MNDKEFETMMKKVEPPKDSKERKPRAITCPICGRRELAFVTEWHKSWGLRIFSGILLFLYALMVVNTFEEYGFKISMSFITGLIPYLLLRLAITCIESKTHVKAICKDCGHIWLLD